MAASITKPTSVMGPITPMKFTTRGDEMNADSGAIVTGVLAVIGGVVWLVRLEGRVNTNESKHDALKDSHDDLKADVKYIRERIDDALSK